MNFGSINISGSPFPSFFGSSCASPQAAGVAALILEGKLKYANQKLSPQLLRTLLQSTAKQNGAPGYNVVTGYGLIQADTAMKTFASPVPVITKLVLQDTTIRPGTQPVTVTVQGNYISSNSVITFRGQPLTTTVISSTQASATVPTFTGNPAIQVFTKSISPNGNDGGYSDTLFFFSPVKKTIIVKADNKTKRYGEQIPHFTVTVLVDSVPIQNTGLTLAQLRLDSLDFTTPATNNTDVEYFIRPSIHRPLNNTNPVDIGLIETYNYILNDGILSINKMPLLITPKTHPLCMVIRLALLLSTIRILTQI